MLGRIPAVSQLITTAMHQGNVLDFVYWLGLLLLMFLAGAETQQLFTRRVFAVYQPAGTRSSPQPPLGPEAEQSTLIHSTRSKGRAHFRRSVNGITESAGP